MECISTLENIYQIKVDGIITSSKYKWYEYGKKSYFLSEVWKNIAQSKVKSAR